MKYTILMVLSLLFLAGCGNGNSEESTPAIYTPDEVSSSTTEGDEDTQNDVDLYSGEVVTVPFTDKHGLKFVEVKINDAIAVDMAIDTGCTGATISVNEAAYLYNKGAITDDDISHNSSIGTLADGSISIKDEVVLRKVVIGNKIVCKDVKVAVMDDPNVTLLLGADILDRAASYEIDNQNQVINFKMK